MTGMDTPPLPHGLDRRDLAQLCARRAQELHARAWRSDAERDAMREATADLLRAVARQLENGAVLAPAPAARPLDEAELRALIATRVVHQPLHPTSPPDDLD